MKKQQPGFVKTQKRLATVWEASQVSSSSVHRGTDLRKTGSLPFLWSHECPAELEECYLLQHGAGLDACGLYSSTQRAAVVQQITDLWHCQQSFDPWGLQGFLKVSQTKLKSHCHGGSY